MSKRSVDLSARCVSDPLLLIVLTQVASLFRESGTSPMTRNNTAVLSLSRARIGMSKFSIFLWLFTRMLSMSPFCAAIHRVAQVGRHDLRNATFDDDLVHMIASVGARGLSLQTLEQMRDAAQSSGYAAKLMCLVCCVLVWVRCALTEG